jgi:hypothetical protein
MVLLAVLVYNIKLATVPRTSPGVGVQEAEQADHALLPDYK